MRVMPVITESYKHQQGIKKTWVASIDIGHMSVVTKTNSKNLNKYLVVSSNSVMWQLRRGHKKCPMEIRQGRDITFE